MVVDSNSSALAADFLRSKDVEMMEEMKTKKSTLEHHRELRAMPLRHEDRLLSVERVA